MSIDGRWLDVRWLDGHVRRDWIPYGQPPAPPGRRGLWHSVADGWDGSTRWEWHEDGAAPPPWVRPPGQTMVMAAPEHRRAALTLAIQRRLDLGFRIESQTETTAAMARGKPVNHVLHLLLSLFTCGAWSLVWAVLAFGSGVTRVLITVDEYGHTRERRTRTRS